MIPGIGAGASYLDSGARLLRAEYQGQELSRDRHNPTLLELTGKDVTIDLIGNSVCAELDYRDITIVYYCNGSDTGFGFSHFDANGECRGYIGNPSGQYVGNDVFEVAWAIRCVTEVNGDTSLLSTIPNSGTPKYYITFGLEESDYQVPQGSAPAIVRAELGDVELSTDINNPTVIPYFNNIKLVGNSACVSKKISVQLWHNGRWTRSGQNVYFNSSAFGVYSIGNAGRSVMYNDTVALELAVVDEVADRLISMSPKYYIIYQDEDSTLVDFAVNGLFHTVQLRDNQLIIEVKQGYIFDGSDMILRDKTDNQVYELGVWINNPDCAGCQTSRIVYSNLPLKKGNIYELSIPARAVLYDYGIHDINNLKYNREYTTELIVEGSVVFTDIDDDDWSYPYVKELTEKRVVNGYEDGTFRPNGHVTRSEFAKIMALGLQIPLVGDGAPQTFADVDASNWAFRYIETVRPYLTGFSDGELFYFKGLAPAVREDMAVALVMAMGLENQSVEVDDLATVFSDYESISKNLREYVLIAYNNGLIDGYPDGTFGPQKTITRTETAALLSKVYKSDAMEKVTFER